MGQRYLQNNLPGLDFLNERSMTIARNTKRRRATAVTAGLVNMRGLNAATPRNARFWSQMHSSFSGHLSPRFINVFFFSTIAPLDSHSEIAGIGQARHHIL